MPGMKCQYLLNVNYLIDCLIDKNAVKHTMTLKHSSQWNSKCKQILTNTFTELVQKKNPNNVLVWYLLLFVTHFINPRVVMTVQQW